MMNREQILSSPSMPAFSPSYPRGPLHGDQGRARDQSIGVEDAFPFDLLPAFKELNLELSRPCRHLVT